MEVSKAVKRIKNQLKQIQQNPPFYWRVVVTNEYQWVVWMDADEFSPFYGISIKVHVKFPENYPFSKPEIKLDNFKIFFHANISPIDGNVCHKIVQSDQMIGIRQRIEALRTLFGCPNSESYLNSQAAQMNIKDQKNNTRTWFKQALKIFRGWQKK